MKWKRLLLAVASPSGIDTAVLSKAAHLASAFGAQLEIFHCVFDEGIPGPGRDDSIHVESDIRELVEARHRQLEAIADPLRAQKMRVQSSVRWDYPPHEGLVRQALRQKPDLLIAQSTRYGQAPLPLTYSDLKLIETCPCPLLLVRTAGSYEHVRLVAAVDPEHRHDKPAELDDAILESANTFSEALAGELLVFHARTPWADAARVMRKLELIPEPPDGKARAAYLERVEARVRSLAQRHGIDDSRVRVVDGYPAACLPPFARENSAGIVAMGAISRSLVERLLIGHTAERVLDALDCDVLTVKPAGFRSPVSRQSAYGVEPPP